MLRGVNEGRKRVLWICATILAARKLAQIGDRPSPALQACIANAVSMAEKIMRAIDAKFPTTET
jgi:hypothetical protein